LASGKRLDGIGVRLKVLSLTKQKKK